MKRNFSDRSKAFFIELGRRSKLLRGPAIIGLALSILLGHFINYCKNGTKRFACAFFILLCFMVGNSFAYPVFGEENGFVSNQENKSAIAVAAESDVQLVDEQTIEYEELEILEDEDVLEGYDDAELHGMDSADKYLLDEILEENQSLLTETGKETNAASKEALTAGENKAEGPEVSFSKDDWRLVLINKQHPVPDDYTVTLGTIKTMKGDMKCDERIIEDLLSMLQAARNDGVNLAICSPYRDLNYQKVLFNRKIKIYMDKGMSYMDAYKISSQAVTVPGASEHQIGLAIDIVSDTYLTLDEGFAETDAGIWLAANSQDYGFILRYPKGKEYITSIEYEPWHFRYVGKEAATVIMSEKITLEEFWDKYL